MEEKHLTQIVIGSSFALFLYLTVVMDLLIMFYSHTEFSVTMVLILIVFFALSLLSIFSRKFGKQIQVFSILSMSLLCFIFNGDVDFYSWGFLLLFIILSYHYGFLNKKIKEKAIIFLFIFIITISFSAFINKKPSIIPASIIYFLCVFFYICFIFRKMIKSLLKSDIRIADLENELGIKEKEIEEQRASLLMTESTVSNIAKKISILEEENLRLKNNIRDSISIYYARKMQIIDDSDFLESSLKKVIPDLRNIEYRILLKFYLSGGSLTNAQLAYELDLSEQNIKNALRSIFLKLDVKSRTELITRIDNIFMNTINESRQ